MYIYYNDRLIEEAVLQPISQGFQFGYGVFETILLAKGVPCFADAHLQRLQKGCHRLGLELRLDAEAICNQAMQLVEVLNISEGRLKLICFRDADGDSTIMTLAPYHLEEAHRQKGFSLAVSSIKRNPYSPLCSLKSLNYAENILAKEEAKAQGYDEAFFLNIHDKLCEGAVSNIFWVRGNRIFTPEPDSGILEGITRSQIIEICRQLKIELEQGNYDLDELSRAEEVFVTNSLMGIMPVSKVDNIIYNIADYKITEKLYNEYKRYIEADINKTKN